MHENVLIELLEILILTERRFYVFEEIFGLVPPQVMTRSRHVADYIHGRFWYSFLQLAYAFDIIC